MRALFCGALALALTVAIESSGQAEQPKSARVWLDWSRGPGTEECVAPDEVVREVEQLLGKRTFAPRSEADRTLHVDVTHDDEPSRYTARMLLLSKAGQSLGTREIVIEAKTCQEAAEAFVLAISMLADLPRTAEETAAAATSAPAAPAPARPEEWHLQARVGPAMTLDVNGSVALGGHAGMMVTPPTIWPLGVDVLSTVQSRSPSETTRYLLSSTALAATLCVPPHRAHRFALTGCLGPQMTLHIGSGSGFAVDRTAVQVTYGGVLEGYGLYAITSAVRLFAMLALAATPQQVDVVFVDSTGQQRHVHLTSNATVSASLGLAIDIF